MENKQEYYCSKCNSLVEENESVCENCGADLNEIIVESGWSTLKTKILSFINKFRKYHRASYYFFLGPLLMLITNILLVLLGIVYYEYFKNTVGRLQISFVFDYFSYILITIPYVLPVFVFTHLYLNGDLKLKIKISLVICLALFLTSIILQYTGLSRFGVILLSIILLEISFVRYAQKDYKILVISLVIFIAWFEFFSLGELQREIVLRDYKKITKQMNVIKTKVDIISVPDDYEKYDMTIPYIILTKKDTLQLVLKYKKVWKNSIPSQQWKLVDWTIDSVFKSVYYYPKPKI